MTGRKTILITGAGSGMGRDAALTLAGRGHRVIATTFTDGQAEALKAFANGEGREIETFKLDITDEGDRNKIEEYALDVLINNAAIGETGPLAEIPLERVRRTFETNVFSTIALTQIALKNMVQRGSGTVLVISSLAGRIPQTFFGGAYSMSKFALSGGIAALRGEMHRIAPRVHVSLIEPGMYGTGFNQRMMGSKYEWLDEKSMFYKLIPSMRTHEAQIYKLFEHKSTNSIVNKIVKAAEARKPRLRYSAPWYQALYIRLMRIFGV